VKLRTVLFDIFRVPHRSCLSTRTTVRPISRPRLPANGEIACSVEPPIVTTFDVFHTTPTVSGAFTYGPQMGHDKPVVFCVF